MSEAFVAILSGVLLWMGLWDLIEEVIPPLWYLKALMIVVGGSGLLCMRRLYEPPVKPVLLTKTATQAGATTSTSAEALPEEGGVPAALEAPPKRRRYFDAPRFDPKKCAHSLCALTLGLILWVGLWDVVDYHLIPAVTSQLIQHNGSLLGVCQHAGDEVWAPGFQELANHPACALTKLLLAVVGALGLFVTRALYGQGYANEPGFRRLP